MTAENLDPRIEELERRLAAEFAASVGAEAVTRCVAEARARYASATIDAYLPMFVARHARELLRTAATQG